VQIFQPMLGDDVGGNGQKTKIISIFMSL
jgi:hypothetical protein